MARTLGIGIIGAGVIAQDHLKAYALLGERVVAIADIDPAKLRQITNAHFVPIACRDYQEMLGRGDVDVVDICTPPNLHKKMVCDALDAGKYVICEKPLAHTLKDCDEIISFAGRHPGKLSVVFQLRFLDEVRRIIALRDQGLLGELKGGLFERFSPLAGTAASGTGWWGRWSVAGGGAVMTQFIHELDLACYIFGKPVEVDARIETRQVDIESEDSAEASIRFENGALVRGNCSLAVEKFSRRIEVESGKMTIRTPWQIDCAEDVLKSQAEQLSFSVAPPPPTPPSRKLAARVWRKGLRTLRLGGWPPPKPPVSHLPYLRDVLAAASEGPPLPLGPEEARGAVELCTAIYTSGITGQPVKLPLEAGCRFYEGITTEDYDGHKRLAGGSD